jgi:hypothetical protein
MAQAWTWCEACQKTHESREECPKGLVRSMWLNAFISSEEFEKELEKFTKSF